MIKSFENPSNEYLASHFRETYNKASLGSGEDTTNRRKMWEFERELVFISFLQCTVFIKSIYSNNVKY